MTPWSRDRRALTLGLLISVSAWAFETLAVATVLPVAASELGGLPLFGWALTAFVLTNLLTTAIAGGEIDRLGPARPMLVGYAIFAAGLAMAGLAPTMLILVAARAIQGVGSGIIAAGTSVIVGRAYPEAARPRMLALLSSAWVIPGLSGPALAGVIADVAGWRWVFIGIIPIAVIAPMLILPAVRSIPASGERAPDLSRVQNALFVAGGMGILLAGLTMPHRVVAAAAVAAGILLLARGLRGLLPPGTARGTPGTPAAVAIMALLSLGFYGTEAFIPLLLTEIRDAPAAIGGLPLTASAMTWTAGSWLLERRATVWERSALARGGLLLIAASILATGLLLLPGTPVLLAPVIWAVGGLGVGLAYATCQLVTLETTPSELMGRATASLQLAHTASIALATGLGGALIAHAGTEPGSFSRALVLQGALMLAAVIVGIAICGRLRAASSPFQPAAFGASNAPGIT